MLLLWSIACAGPDTADDSSPSDSGADSADSGADTGGDTGAAAFDCDPDWAALTGGVATVDQGGSLPSALVVFGEEACPILLDGDDRAYLATARFGEGRVVHTGHEAMFTDPEGQSGDTLTLFTNALAWVSPTKRPRIGTEERLPVTSWLRERYEVVQVTPDELGTVDVLLTTAYVERDAAGHAAVRDFVAGGGGLLSGGHAWYWASENPDLDPALDFPGNQVLADMGLSVTEWTVSVGRESVPTDPPSPLVHAGRALDAIGAHLDGSAPLSRAEQRKAADTVGMAVTLLPFSFAAYFDPVRALLDAVPPVLPTVDAPLDRDAQPVEALLVTILSRFAAELPAEEVTDVGAAFPGPVPATSPRETTSVVVLASYAGRDAEYGYSNPGAPVWRGTGVYVPPGEVVRVTLPDGWVGTGVDLLVGAHTDTLWDLDEWSRFPAITRAWPVEAATTAVASGFGGPLYVRVPAGLELGEGTVVVEGGVRYARFVSEAPDAADFAARRDAAPLAELEGRSFVLTVPADEMPADVDPAGLTTFWDEVLDADADLAAIDRDRVRAERFAMDVQISAGWMHSGYPLMGYQYTATLTDLGLLRAVGDWGAFHELGHNHQFGPLNLPGTTECTVNLWSVYASEEVVGLPRAQAHPALDPDERADTLAAWVAGGRDFEADWNVWTCLETYLQLQEAFGWDFYRALHATYLAMPDADRPDTDQERIDRWVVESSRQAGRDLTGFYEAWGFPMSAATFAATADLPDWTGHPME